MTMNLKWIFARPNSHILPFCCYMLCEIFVKNKDGGEAEAWCTKHTKRTNEYESRVWHNDYHYTKIHTRVTGWSPQPTRDFGITISGQTSPRHHITNYHTHPQHKVDHARVRPHIQSAQFPSSSQSMFTQNTSRHTHRHSDRQSLRHADTETPLTT